MYTISKEEYQRAFQVSVIKYIHYMFDATNSQIRPAVPETPTTPVFPSPTACKIFDHRFLAFSPIDPSPSLIHSTARLHAAMVQQPPRYSPYDTDRANSIHKMTLTHFQNFFESKDFGDPCLYSARIGCVVGSGV